jgi:hypothetical protein
MLLRLVTLRRWLQRNPWRSSQEGENAMRNVVLMDSGVSFDGILRRDQTRARSIGFVPHATSDEGHDIFRRLRERIDTVLVGRQ